MSKKIYIQPFMEVATFTASNIINTSVSGAKSFSINDEYVDEEEGSASSIWGKQL